MATPFLGVDFGVGEANAIPDAPIVPSAAGTYTVMPTGLICWEVAIPLADNITVNIDIVLPPSMGVRLTRAEFLKTTNNSAASADCDIEIMSGATLNAIFGVADVNARTRGFFMSTGDTNSAQGDNDNFLNRRAVAAGGTIRVAVNRTPVAAANMNGRLFIYGLPTA